MSLIGKHVLIYASSIVLVPSARTNYVDPIYAYTDVDIGLQVIRRGFC